MNNPAALKQCTRCKTDLPLDQYNYCKSTVDHLQVWCRACRVAYSKAHYQKNAAKYNARRCDLYQKNKISRNPCGVPPAPAPPKEEDV